MVKKLIKFFSVFLCCAVLLIGVAYLGLSYYYQNGFAYGTWLNGIYCTGKTVDEVNKELTAGYSYEGIQVNWGDGKSSYIKAEDVSFGSDFAPAVAEYLKNQNCFSWYKNLFGQKNGEIKPEVYLDEEQLKEKFLKLPIISEQEALKPYSYEINKDSEGYHLHDGTKGILNVDKAINSVKNGLLLSLDSIDLNDEDCFEDAVITSEMEKILSLWNKLDAYQSLAICYEFDDNEEQISKASLCSFLLKDDSNNFVYDEQGEFIIDSEAVDSFVDDLADRHDTLGKHLIHATRGEDVLVEGGTYGNKMDREKEKTYLYETVCQRKSEKHEPEYIQKAKSTGENDIGDTYVEVDITEQMLYYYVDGKIKLKTPVVTGNELLKRDTPCGVNYIYLKQKNRVLRGPGYASPVKFWMPVNKGIGIHDASWRSEYGEEIYKTNGSHGCINTPIDIMTQLYDMAEVGTPVIILK